VTFLLFLASVAVLEYLLDSDRQKSGGAAESREIKHLVSYDQLVANEASTTDLLSLGKALDAQKAGKVPESEPTPKEGILH
jgi:hypothetical protein